MKHYLQKCTDCKYAFWYFKKLECPWCGGETMVLKEVVEEVKKPVKFPIVSDYRFWIVTMILFAILLFSLKHFKLM